MKVMKFGGTSVGSADRIKNVTDLICRRDGQKFVVLSAMSGTTNQLLQISQAISEGKKELAEELISSLESKYKDTVEALLGDDPCRGAVEKTLGESFRLLRDKSELDSLGTIDENEIVARGELMSTALMSAYLHRQGVDVKMLYAPDFMRKRADGEPDEEYIEKHLSETVEANGPHEVYLTQGFICCNSEGEIDNLARGGSDYTASLIGAVLRADEIEIWTDIDGMHNNDPRYVENTSPVSELHFEEAAELAYFGAKILHPTCVLPAKKKNIPVRLLNTMQPDAPGTVIYNTEPSHSIKAVAAKDGITAIKIKSGRMLLAYGFLRRVFEVFETYRTPIDMIVTSEVGVSVTIDNVCNLPQIVAELEKLGTVSVDNDLVIICVVGDLEWQNRGFEAKVVEALSDIPVRMISYGGSNYDISLLVRKVDKTKALNLLSEKLFNAKD